jgi:hypothetical protein
MMPPPQPTRLSAEASGLNYRAPLVRTCPVHLGVPQSDEAG